MKRYLPEAPVILAPAIATAIVVASSAIILVLMYPARGQECRFAWECAAVAEPAASKATPAHRYRVREVRPVRHFHRPAHRTRMPLKDKPQREDTMPLIWPPFDEADEVAPTPVRTVGVIPAAFIVREEPRTYQGTHPGTVPVQDVRQFSETSRRSILAAFLSIVGALLLGTFVAGIKFKEEQNEARTGFIGARWHEAVRQWRQRHRERDWQAGAA